LNIELMTPLATTLLETDLIRTFVAISEFGSFSAAARKVNRTPSAISMQVKKLEEQLGRRLFMRDGRAVSLTSDGETLLSYARDMLRINEEAVSRFQQPAVEGKVSFGAPDDFGTRFLPNFLRRFAATHPQVEVAVSLSTSELLLEQFHGGDLDMVLITAVRGGSNEELGEIVYAEPLHWTGVKDGQAHKSDILPLAVAGRSCSWRGAAIDALVAHERRYRVAYTCENCQGQIAALLGDLAIAPLPASLISSQLERLGKRESLPDIGEYDIRLCKNTTMGEAARAFCSHVEDSFKSI
jgi:DNA-binding transcriptional LysR family regulator